MNRWMKTRNGTQAPDGKGKLIDNMYAKCRDSKVVFRPKVPLMELLTDKSHLSKPPKRKPKPQARPQSAPTGLKSPRSEAHAIFMGQKAQRVEKEKLEARKALPWAQHTLGMRRWEMANLITNEGSEEACEWLAKWEHEQPNQEVHATPKSASATPRRQWSDTKPWPRRRNSLCAVELTDVCEKTMVQQSQETTVHVACQPPRIEVPELSRTMRHPTQHTLQPWITETFKSGIDEQKLVRHEVHLKNVSSELSHIKDKQAHDAATTSIIFECKKLALVKGPVTTPLCQLAKAESDVAKVKSKLFEVPLRGHSRVPRTTFSFYVAFAL